LARHFRAERYYERMAKTPYENPAQSPTFAAMESIRGKIVEDFELKTLPGNSRAHGTEELTIFFRDGSRLRIIGTSNAYDLSLEHKGLKASDFDVDIFARFIP
jgi:hypothetical protein